MTGLRFLAEIKVRDPDAMADEWLYVCTGPDLVIHHLDPTAPDRVYRRGLRRSIEITETLAAGDRIGGDASAVLAALVLEDLDGSWSYLRSWGFGRAVRLLVGSGTLYAGYTLIAGGIAERPRAEDRTLEIPLKDARARLDVDWQLRWAGTATSGGAGDGGDPDLEDTVQPVALGTVRNIEPPWSNRYDERLMLTAGGALGGFDAHLGTFDKGVSVSVTEHAADGIVELAATATGQPTADVRGAGAVSGAATLADIVDWLADRAGWASIDTAALGALKTAEPGEIGLYVTGETAIPELLDRLMRHAEGWWRITPEEELTVGLLTDPAGETVSRTIPKWAIKKLRLLPPPGGLAPAWRVVVRFQRNHRVQKGEEFDTAATAARKALMENEWRQTTRDQASVLTVYPNARAIERESLYDARAGAEALAARLEALYSPARTYAEAEIEIAQAAAIRLGDVIVLDTDEHGLDALKLKVLHRVVSGRRDQVTVRAWG